MSTRTPGPPGTITRFRPPLGPGVRIDTHLEEGSSVSPYYDSLIAKLIVRGKDREEAISRMTRALNMFVVEGIYTSIPLHKRILADPDFRAGRLDTKFMERLLERKQQAAD